MTDAVQQSLITQLKHTRMYIQGRYGNRPIPHGYGWYVAAIATEQVSATHPTRRAQ